MKTLARLWKVVELWTRRGLGLLFPDTCVGCGTFGVLICNACVSAIHFPVISVDTSIMAGCFYQDKIVKDLIHHFKFRQRKEALDPLQKRLYETFQASLKRLGVSEVTPIVLVPIPLWHERQRERGFNQASVIAHILERANPSVFSVSKDGLIRIRRTRPQTETASKKGRAENIRGCFRHGGGEVKGKVVVVIDDIVTTGATMREAMRVLKKAGAKNVYGFALAH